MIIGKAIRNDVTEVLSFIECEIASVERHCEAHLLNIFLQLISLRRGNLIIDFPFLIGRLLHRHDV
jgi:hypothetical protein